MVRESIRFDFNFSLIAEGRGFDPRLLHHYWRVYILNMSWAAPTKCSIDPFVGKLVQDFDSGSLPDPYLLVEGGSGVRAPGDGNSCLLSIDFYSTGLVLVEEGNSADLSTPLTPSPIMIKSSIYIFICICHNNANCKLFTHFLK